ncbi:tRNA (adenosine(37)-N6)-dimethylallyltransferase MiaA [bacterium]|jgi:tRNA dimethylallyltransferase|nr:tRNA (adenosine(37)-N6)-dimethylallyltransferase MiaA [bacterium]
MRRKKKQKIIVIVGPTASGKSDLAVEIARKHSGEVISADSRQVYKGLDIGTGKITKKEMKGVPHHLLDVVSPKRVFTVVDFKEKAERAIKDIASRGKLPIIAGGTGFYIQAFIDNIDFPAVPANKKLREKLATKKTEELFEEISRLDQDRAASIDPKNKQRLIRAIEIVRTLGKVPKAKQPSRYDVLMIGIKIDNEKLRKRIEKRLKARMKRGMIAEAKRLHKKGLSYKRMEELGLEYRCLAKFLRGKITKKELVREIEIKDWQYAKRQKTWFERDKRIRWFPLAEQNKIIKLVFSF